MKKSAPAVLLGLSHTSLPVARSLGRRGISVFGMDKDQSRIGAKSRYIQFLNAPADEEALLKALIDFAESQGSKSVLFPFSDEYLLFISRNEDKLSRHFWFPHSNEWPLERLISKETMANTFKELGVLSPKSAVLRKDSPDELKSFNLVFPIVMKPNFHEKWLNDPEVVKNIGTRKVLLIDDLPSLEKYCRLLGRYDKIVAQEFIPGKTENLYYYVGYRNGRGRMLVSFVGRKRRTFPDGFGSECFLQSVHHPDLCKLGEEILGKLNYVGPAGLDFKFDARDQRYKLIEINCRLGISDGLLVTCGVEVPYIYYRDVQGMSVEAQLEYRKNVYWCWLEKEIDWFLEYRSRDGYTPLRWLKHFLSNPYSYAAYAKDDLGPFFFVIAGIVRRFRKGIARKVRLSS